MSLLYPLWLEVHRGQRSLLTVAWQGYRDLCPHTATAFQRMAFTSYSGNHTLGLPNDSAMLGVTKSPGGGISLPRELKLASRATDLAEGTATFHQSKY